MKRIAMILMAVVMVFVSVPVNASGDSDAVQAEELILSENATVIGVIEKCWVCPDGYVNVTCQEISHVDYLGDCTWSSHEYHGCTVSNIFRYHNGRCESCNTPYYRSYEVPDHKHSQLHSFYGGGREELVGCIFC